VSDRSTAAASDVADASRALSGAPSAGKTHLGEVAFDDVFPFITFEKSRREYVVNGVAYSVKMDSERYHLFKESRACSACGLVGTRLMLDIIRGANSPHFNLYAEENGALVLMTKDHIIPRSAGGTNALDNLRTMCAPCNEVRGSYDSLTLEQICELRRLRTEVLAREAECKVAHDAVMAAAAVSNESAEYAAALAHLRDLEQALLAVLRRGREVHPRVDLASTRRLSREIEKLLLEKTT